MNERANCDDTGVTGRIEEYLKRLEIKYGKTMMDDREVFGVPWVINDKDFLVLIQVQDGWVWLSSAILLEPHRPKENQSSFLVGCLQANHSYPEISFDIDEHGTLGASREVHFSVINSDVGFSQFKQAFFAIPATIKHFLVAIAPTFSVHVPGFREMVETFIKKVQE